MAAESLKAGGADYHFGCTATSICADDRTNHKQGNSM